MSTWQNSIKKVSSYCADHQLLRRNDGVIIGISGGPDSVFAAYCLRDLASELHLSCHLAHVNYGTRGRDSDSDERLCHDLAERLSWPISVLRVRPEDYQKSCENNFQAWARQRRYDFFCDLTQQYHLNGIVVAHHLSDQVETFLLRLLRGSGPSGLSAMRPYSSYNGVSVLRPLLCLSREEILESLAQRHIEYHLDSTNESDRYRRNLLRKGVLPQLRAIEPHFERLTGEALLLWQGEDALLRDLAAENLKTLKVSTTDGGGTSLQIARKGLQLLPLSLRLRVLREMIAELTEGPQSITFHHIRKIDELVCQGPERAKYDLPERLVFEQGPLVLTLKVVDN